MRAHNAFALPPPGSSCSYPLALPKSRDQFGDGWHGGYWEIVDGCNRTIAGGGPKTLWNRLDNSGNYPDAWMPGGHLYMEGVVLGFGGQKQFGGNLDLCCGCDVSASCTSPTIGSAAELETCAVCEAGKYSSGVDVSECIVCVEIGTYAASRSVTVDACESCAPGKADLDSSPASPCEDCPSGAYAAEAGADACADCPAGGTSAYTVGGVLYRRWCAQLCHCSFRKRCRLVKTLCMLRYGLYGQTIGDLIDSNIYLNNPNGNLHYVM